jgi:hypothetical protein
VLVSGFGRHQGLVIIVVFAIADAGPRPVNDAITHHAPSVAPLSAGLLSKVNRALEAIVDDREHPSHCKAIDGILNRTGLHEVTESKKTVVHSIDAQELIVKIRAMSERLGIVIDPTKLLPQKKQLVIEAEYEEKLAKAIDLLPGIDGHNALDAATHNHGFRARTH